MDLFSDLKKLGIGNIGDIFEEEKEKKVKKAVTSSVVEKLKTPEELEAEMLFDKHYTCSICDKTFTTKAVRASRAKLLSLDSDYRPIYANVDTTKYEAIVCPICGYGALARYFEASTLGQRKLIREQISVNFKGLPAQKDIVLSYDEAMLRMEIVLANAVVKKAKYSEKAFICLKIAWIIRGKKEELEKKGTLTPEQSKALEAEELEYIKQAYHGFTSAVSKENFPICGMDDMTLIYIMADMARKLGDKSQALKFLGEVIVSKTAKKGLKDKAMDLKDLILAEDKK